MSPGETEIKIITRSEQETKKGTDKGKKGVNYKRNFRVTLALCNFIN
jgi:hypothetical protein